MKIPRRLLPPALEPGEVTVFSKLCDAIAAGVAQKSDVSQPLATWNARANRRFEPNEFANYDKSTDTADFVRGAMMARPARVDDLRADEAVAVLEAVCNASLPESEEEYFLEWLDVQFPNANVSDLIYWPDQWFNTEDATNFDLSPAQMLFALMERTGRRLPGARDERLPWSAPNAST